MGRYLRSLAGVVVPSSCLRFGSAVGLAARSEIRVGLRCSLSWSIPRGFRFDPVTSLYFAVPKWKEIAIYYRPPSKPQCEPSGRDLSYLAHPDRSPCQFLPSLPAHLASRFSSHRGRPILANIPATLLLYPSASAAYQHHSPETLFAFAEKFFPPFPFVAKLVRLN